MVISQYLFRIYMFIFQDVPTLELFNFISFINESYTRRVTVSMPTMMIIADANIYCLPNTPITS